MRSNNSWDEIIAESSARPVPLTEDRFRSWIGRQGIFVSSVMDAEMTPYRNAVRTYLRGNGTTPLMWEEITPQDKGARRAYLDGVDQASIFVLLLGRSYGVADASGASPTNQEELHPAGRNIPRLLFTLSGVDPAERDAKLNRWLGSLYNELSGATFDAPAMLVASLDAKLRELAAQSDRTWIKLGSLVFPGKVKASFNPGGGGGSGSSVAMMGGADSKQRWIRLAFFGEQIESDAQRRNYNFDQVFSSPDAKTLPDVLKATAATGWLAEGLVRLYIVEEVALRYGGQFQYLDISSPTAKGVRVKGRFSMNNEGDTTVEGLVPL